MKRLTPFIILLFAGFLTLHASETDSVEYTEAEMMAMYKAYADSVVNTFSYETGSVSLRSGLAEIVIPSGFKYLNGDDSETVLVDLWGNPPNEEEPSLGMLIPADHTPMTDSSFAINITYVEDGHVKDADAKDIDYDELLETMKKSTSEANAYRTELGYLPIELIGWAKPPFYDSENKKLHWAKELKFGDLEENTLNYNIRILGRKGYLQLNVIGEMYTLGEVNAKIDPVLSSVNFKPGNTYSDFDPSIDKIAAYGIGGLIAGKVLAKAGILAKVGIFLAKFWKIVAVAVVALFAGLRKIFGAKSQT